MSRRSKVRLRSSPPMRISFISCGLCCTYNQVILFVSKNSNFIFSKHCGIGEEWGLRETMMEMILLLMKNIWWKYINQKLLIQKWELNPLSLLTCRDTLAEKNLIILGNQKEDKIPKILEFEYPEKACDIQKLSILISRKRKIEDTTCSIRIRIKNCQ